MTAKKVSKAEQGVEEALSYMSGKREGFRVTEVEAPQVDFKVIRQRLEMTQTQFAEAFGIPLATLKNWEQGHRQLEGVARLFFRLIERNPTEMKKQVQELHLAEGS